MSDNVTKLHNNRPERRKMWILCASVAVVLAVLALILFWDALNIDALGRRIRYGSAEKREGYGYVSYDAHNTNRYGGWGDGLAIASVSGLQSYTQDGEKDMVKELSLSNPALKSGNKMVLCYDIGGKHLLVSGVGQDDPFVLEADGVYFDADISQGNAVCTATSESGYKTVLRVYDKDQKEIYRWFSATQYLPVCAVSENAKHMAAVGLGQENGNFKSTISFFLTDSEDVQATADMGDSLIYDLCFIGNDKVCAIGEDAVTWLDTDGETKGSFDLTSWYLQDYDFGGDGFVLLSLNMYKAGDRSSVYSVDHNGEQLGSLFVGAEVLDISACGKYVAILTTEELMICHRDMTPYVTTENRWTATSVLMRKDGSAYVISGNSAEIYIP